jgi:hypothetical protein
MKIEIVNITEKNLRDAPEWETYPFSCKYCIWWEFLEECKDTSKEKKEEMIQKKLKWLGIQTDYSVTVGRYFM